MNSQARASLLGGGGALSLLLPQSESPSYTREHCSLTKCWWRNTGRPAALNAWMIYAHTLSQSLSIKPPHCFKDTLPPPPPCTLHLLAANLHDVIHLQHRGTAHYVQDALLTDLYLRRVHELEDLRENLRMYVAHADFRRVLFTAATFKTNKQKK